MRHQLSLKRFVAFLIIGCSVLFLIALNWHSINFSANAQETQPIKIWKTGGIKQIGVKWEDHSIGNKLVILLIPENGGQSTPVGELTVNTSSGEINTKVKIPQEMPVGNYRIHIETRNPETGEIILSSPTQALVELRPGKGGGELSCGPVPVLPTLPRDCIYLSAPVCGPDGWILPSTGCVAPDHGSEPPGELPPEPGIEPPPTEEPPPEVKKLKIDEFNEKIQLLLPLIFERRRDVNNLFGLTGKEVYEFRNTPEASQKLEELGT